MIFLFTDIEGSTARWESSPDAMARAVRRHDEIVRGGIEAYGGIVFKTVGDAFCATFADAQAALGATIEAQRRLQSEDWSEVGGLRVRMALHAGDAEERDDDYFGGSVNRVARLMGAAHGGQIVVSGAIADALAGDLPEGVSLLALGVFRLKDLRERERVLQVVAPGLESEFKPLRSLDAVPNNLPQQTSGFVGREADVTRVAELLRASTLVTITGPGGVGKTRLALQSAAEAIDRMKNGAWIVNLAPILDPDLISSTVLGALGTSPGVEDATKALLSYLADREILLVLDNCEHLIADVARTIDAIRRQCPQVTVLATSREALHLDGEYVYRLAPLDAADALRLFAQRAAAADGNFAVTAANRPTVEEICGHLDGIPLAIELAAARVRLLTLEDLSARLVERFRILTGGNRTALPRQQTLRALIDWSYDLLAEEEKRFFRRLSPFKGGFSLDGAIAVCADEGTGEWEVLDLLVALVDKSLIAGGPREPGGRYRLLESIGEYARERLHEAGETAAIAARHVSFIADRAAEAYVRWNVRPAAAAVAEMIPELDNLRAALQWALGDNNDAGLGAQLAADASPVLLEASLLGEGVAWTARALDNAPTNEMRGRLEYMRSMFLNNLGAYPPALSAAERAVPLLQGAPEDREVVRALAQVAQQYSRAGNFTAAERSASEAMTRARSIGDAFLFADVTRRCAFSLPATRIEEARRQFAEAVVELEAVGGFQETCSLLMWWAEAEAAAGCFDRAREIGSRALALSSEEVMRMHLTSNIAGYALAAGDLGGAVPFTREALELALAANHPLLTAIAIGYFAAIRGSEDPEDAARLFGYARAQMATIGWTGIASDERAREEVLVAIATHLDAARLAICLEEGAALSGTEALARLSR